MVHLECQCVLSGFAKIRDTFLGVHVIGIVIFWGTDRVPPYFRKLSHGCVGGRKGSQGRYAELRYALTTSAQIANNPKVPTANSG